MDTRKLPVLSVGRARDAEVDLGRWPVSIPAVRQVLTEGLEFGALTVLVGENGAGKSTLVEAVAQAYGLSPEGGSTGARLTTRASESPLWESLWLRRGIGAARWGFFLRAETMHGYYTYLEDNPSSSGRGEPHYHEMSHGESFLEVLSTRFTGPGLFVLDEPEAALSFTSSLALVGLLAEIARSDTTQALVATHSPIVAATPGARLLELSDTGIQERSWRELELVDHWSSFLADPDLYLRHLEP